MKTLSKLQSEAVKEIDKITFEMDCSEAESKVWNSKLKTLFADQIQKAYKSGIKEVLRNVEYNAQTKIWDIPEKKLLSIQSKGKMK